MDPLEQQLREAFSQIPFGEGSVMDQDVIYSLAIEGNRAEAMLIVEQEHESLIEQTAKAVHEVLMQVEGIAEVGIQVVDSLEEAQAAEKEAKSAEACGCGSPAGSCESAAPKQAQGASQNPHPSRTANPAPPQAVNYLGEYEFIILVASGKGGVGKSTTAVNLALALKSLGKSVSLLDADIYGPSLPTMMGARGEFPEIIGQAIQPMSRHGIEFMSMGSLVDEEEAMIWRGPMAHQAVEQMLRDTTWPGGDYMIIDLPPGTGDVQITLAQKTRATGAVVVCTPQDVALMDARKAINMFDKVSIPTLGIVENMSFFKCPGCGEETPIFSTGGAEKEAGAQEVPFLGKIPIELNIRRCGDEGTPIVAAYPEAESSKSFITMAKKLDEILKGA